jgi:hypothetical protein
MEEAVEAIGTTLDERTTCEELAEFVCREVCDAAAVDLLPTDVPAAQYPHEPDARYTDEPDLTRVATGGRDELLTPWSRTAPARCPPRPSTRGIPSRRRSTCPARSPGRS